MPRDSKLLLSLHPGAILWAIALGGVSGAAATLVRLVFRGLQWVFTHSAASSPIVAASLSPWRRFITPILGALIASAILAYRHRRAAKLGRSPRVFVDYVEAVRREHGRIPLIPNLWRTGASAFSIATGAAIGREGSMIQFAAAVTSALERRLCKRWPSMERFSIPLAVACGVAGGVATSYQAPIAAVFFAFEIVLGVYRLEDFVPLCLAAASGCLISRTVLREGPLYPVTGSHSLSLPLLGIVVVIALLMGCLGPAYQMAIRGLGKLSKLPLALVIGGFVVGAFSLWDTRVWGNGDEGLNLALGLSAAPLAVLSLKMLFTVLILRLIATSVCVGVGTVGGVFTPTLFAGAAAAACLARAAHISDPILCAIVGMSCLIAAATHAPLMATFMAVELTGDWRLLPLLFAANLIAWQVAKRLSSVALYAIATDRPKQRELVSVSPQSS